MKLSTLDQIMPPLYTRVVLAFPVPASIPKRNLVLNLRNSAQAVLSEYAFLAGYVQIGANDNDKCGRPELAGFLETPKDQEHLALLEIKNLEGDGSFPHTYNQLHLKGMPMSLLDDNLLAPVGLMRPFGQTAPAFKVQATFIEGGLLLCFCLHHNVGDGSALAVLMSRFASGFNDEISRPASKIAENVSGRELLSQSVDAILSPSKHPEYRLAGPKSAIELDANPPPLPSTMPSMTCGIFYISKANIEYLKQAASPPTEMVNTPWVSTNDAVCALIWSCMTRARSSRIGGKDPTRLLMAVNGRSRLDDKTPLTADFVGNVNMNSIAQLPASEVTSQEPGMFSKVAAAVHDSTRRVDAQHIRSAIALANSLHDIRDLSMAVEMFLGPDIALSSWRGLPFYDPVFGFLGRPAWVQHPSMVSDGLSYIMPSRPGVEGFEVVVGMQSENMEILKADKQWHKYMELRDEYTPVPGTASFVWE
jgi:hypothetical protein